MCGILDSMKRVVKGLYMKARGSKHQPLTPNQPVSMGTIRSRNQEPEDVRAYDEQ